MIQNIDCYVMSGGWTTTLGFRKDEKRWFWFISLSALQDFSVLDPLGSIGSTINPYSFNVPEHNRCYSDAKYWSKRMKQSTVAGDNIICFLALSFVAVAGNILNE
jgi:hypothetical protein